MILNCATILQHYKYVPQVIWDVFIPNTESCVMFQVLCLLNWNAYTRYSVLLWWNLCWLQILAKYSTNFMQNSIGIYGKVSPQTKLTHCHVQSNPYKMFAAYFQPSWPSRPKTNVTLLYYFLKLYNFGFYKIFVGSTGSELQHPWISKIRCEPKNSRKNHFSG